MSFRRNSLDLWGTTPEKCRITSASGGRSGRGDHAEFLEAVRKRLHTTVNEYERITAENRREEARLAAELLCERETAVAARLYADEGLVKRVARAEAHLSRELNKALGLLAACQAHRAPVVPALGLVVTHGPAALPSSAVE